MSRAMDTIRQFDSRGETFARAGRASVSLERLAGPDRVELPLAAWRRMARPQSNVITLRIPSWASSSSKP